MQPQEIAGLPIWVSGLLMVGVAIAGAVLIELAARRVVPMAVRQDHNSVAAAIFTVIGTTYAVLLAFVAMLAWEGFIQAQAITDSEASLVQNVAQLIAGLNGPEMSSMHDDVIAYARTVIVTEWPAQERGAAVAENSASLGHLAQTAFHLRPDNIADGNLHALLLDDINKLANARRERLLAARTPIPAILWLVLVGGGIITVAFASFLGAPNLWMHLAMSSLLAISGTMVLLVIIALSNPFRGEFRVSVEPFERVLTHPTP